MTTARRMLLLGLAFGAVASLLYGSGILLYSSPSPLSMEVIYKAKADAAKRDFQAAEVAVNRAKQDYDAYPSSEMEHRYETLRNIALMHLRIQEKALDSQMEQLVIRGDKQTKLTRLAFGSSLVAIFWFIISFILRYTSPKTKR